MIDADVATYRKQGFLHLRGLLDRREIDDLRRDAVRVFQYQLTARNAGLPVGSSERDASLTRKR